MTPTSIFDRPVFASILALSWFCIAACGEVNAPATSPAQASGDAAQTYADGGAETPLIPLEGCAVWSEIVELGDAPAPAGLESCCTINADVYITDEGATDATLDVLRNVHRIKGSLVINDTLVTNLNSLGRLARVDGDVVIDNNRALDSVAGLKGLAHVGHDLVVRRNDVLRHLTLPALTLVDHGVLIGDHLALENLAGLSALESVSHSVVIRGNRRIKSLAGLEGLVDAGSEGLTLEDNHELNDLTALQGLERSGKALVIKDHFSLTQIKGFAALAETAKLVITGNRSATDINGFSKLHVIDSVDIAGNEKLERVHGLSQIKGLVHLRVVNNKAMSKFTAFGNCGQTGHFEVSDNPSLTELKLGLLQTTGTLTLHRNSSLGTFAGLFPLKYIDIFSVCDNANLPPAKVETFLKQLWKEPQKIDACKAP